MPSQTFYNLPSEKQNTLVAAAIKEFTRVSYEEVSINQIIKEAKIPRGSFYMYFENKEDLYFYLLNNYKNRFQERLLMIIEEEKGNLFETFRLLFNDMTDFCMVPEKRQFFKQVFSNINSKTGNHLFPIKQKREHKKSMEKYELFLSKIDRTKLNVETEEDLNELLELLFMMTVHTLIHSFMSNQDPSEMKHVYKRRIELLKNGMEKE